MSDEIYKLYASVGTSTDAAASLDIREDGLIEGLLLDLYVTGADALSDGGGMEVSFASTSGFVSNDTRASIGGLKTTNEFLTTGGSQTSKNQFCSFSKGIPVKAGERLYLHLLELGAAATIVASAWIYVKTSGSSRMARRRT